MRDREGRRVGTVEKDVLGRSIIRGLRGQRTHTIERRVSNDAVIRNQGGQRVGTITPSNGSFVVRDRASKRAGQASQR